MGSIRLSDEDIKEQLSKTLFNENGLTGMLRICFNTSPYEAINSVYPGKFKAWEFKSTPQGFWTKENIIKAIKWLIEEKLKLSDEELKEELSFNLFKDNGFSGLLNVYINGSPYEAINIAYPNKFKEWEFKQTPRDYWSNKDNGIKVVKWLIEEKLKLSDKELKEQLSQKLFIENGFNGMLQHCFNGSPYEAINETYPNKFKEWEFKQVPQGFWNNKDDGIKSTKWLIEEKLKLTDEQLKEKLSRKLFVENGLGGMIQYCFNNNVDEAINTTYPNKY